MSLKLVIIIPNENNVPLPMCVAQCDQFHHEKLTKYINETGISVEEDILSSENSTKISFALTEQGYCVMLYDEIDNKKSLIIFLPSEMSQKQIEWFEKRKIGLKEYKLFIFVRGKEEWELLDNTTTSIPMITVLNNLLNERYKSSNHTKKRIKEPI